MSHPFRGRLQVTPEFLLSLLTQNASLVDAKGELLDHVQMVGTRWDDDRQQVLLYFTARSHKQLYFEGMHAEPVTLLEKKRF